MGTTLHFCTIGFEFLRIVIVELFDVHVVHEVVRFLLNYLVTIF